MRICIGSAEKRWRRRMALVFTGCFIFLTALGISPPDAAADSCCAAGASPTITIKGAVSNIDDIGAYVVDGSFLQIYPCETTGKVIFHMEKKGKTVQPVAPGDQKYYLDPLGRLVPPSALPRTAFPDFGFFSFNKIKGLTPGGCYKICVKMLDLPYPGFVPLAGPDGKTREIMIPETKTLTSGSPQDILIDLTKETLIVPEPPKQ